MDEGSEQIKKKLHKALKLGGFNVRREFCNHIVDKFQEQDIDLDNNHYFDNCVKNFCSSLEKQCLLGHSIEKSHIDRALEVCLHAGYDRHETVFNVIGVLDFPRVTYNVDRKQYFISDKKPKLLSSPDSRTQLFLDRYTTVLQRTRRDFLKKISLNKSFKIELQTIDYLLTQSSVTLNKIVILGSLLQVSEGKYSLEDPTGIVQLDLSDSKIYEPPEGESGLDILQSVIHLSGLYVENCFVLVNGYYEDKVIKVRKIFLPPGEEYATSKLHFNNINYFGGASETPLRESIKLYEHLQRNRGASFMFFSNVWLDHPLVFEKLEMLFNGFNPHPPAGFIFMGNFMSDSHSSEKLSILRKLFRRLGELICKYTNLVAQSQFIFVPGLEDPCASFTVPRFSLPSFVTEDMKQVLSKAIFTTNPCRIQYCTKEITVFKADILPKLLQASLYKPSKETLADNVTKTIISQGHLAPLSLSALTTHWDLDYTMRLYPLPHLIVIGDKAEAYQGTYKGCQVMNPGSFCESGFQFKAYTPATDDIDDCVL